MADRKMYIMSIILLFMVVTIPSAFSYDYSFVSPINLDSYVVYPFESIECEQSLDDYWYCSFIERYDVGKYRAKIVKYSDEFVLQTSTTHNCGDYCFEIECSLFDYANATYGDEIDCFAHSITTPLPSQWYLRYFLGNDTIATQTTPQYFNGAMYSHTISNRYYQGSGYPMMFLLHKTEVNLQSPYWIANNFSDINEITLPPPFEVAGDLGGGTYYQNQIKVAQCNNNDIFLFMLNKTSATSPTGDRLDVIGFYDDTDFSGYTYNIAPLILSNFSIDYDTYSLWHDPVEDEILLSVLNSSSSQDGLKVGLVVFSCDGYGDLSIVDSTIINQTDIDPTINATAGEYINSTYFLRDRNDVFTIWYNYDGKLNVVYEDFGCDFCANWTATGECSLGKEKFTRYCPPYVTCTNTTYWDYTDYCQDLACTPEWFCVDYNTKAFRQLDCSITSTTDCTGGTPYCFYGDCVSECAEGYYCVNDEVRAYSDEMCQVSEVLNCNSSGDGYCSGGRCLVVQTPAFDEDATVLEIIEEITSGTKQMLSWIAKPVFTILLVIAVVMLILGIFGLIVSLANKSTKGGRGR